ncbi:MAG: hypothetical protein WCQ21_13910 [Verrucomicrobiota bacterium]
MNIKLSMRLVYVGLLAAGYALTAQSQPLPSTQMVRQKCQAVQAKYDIVKAQWFDIYELGLVPGADQAGKLLTAAQQSLSAKDNHRASDLLDQADRLLSVYSKADLPVFEPEKPLSNPAELGKLRKATMSDVARLEIGGLPRWNYWFNFSGKGDDGVLYAIYFCVNYHGTGAQTPPILAVVSCNKTPGKHDDYSMNVVANRKESPDQLSFIAAEGSKTLNFTIRSDRTTIQFQSSQFSADLALATPFSFWYNKGNQPVMIVPGSPGAGFEEPGLASGTITIAGKQIKVTGFAELENYFCGGKGAADYRTALLKFGNEWWVPFATDQVQGIFVATGPYKDAGLFIDGKYVIPSEFHIVQGEARKVFSIHAKTSAGDLLLTFNMWGWNPALMEYWGTVAGTLAGKQLSSGYCWLEHVPQIKVAESGASVSGRKLGPGKK